MLSRLAEQVLSQEDFNRVLADLAVTEVVRPYIAAVVDKDRDCLFWRQTRGGPTEADLVLSYVNRGRHPSWQRTAIEAPALGAIEPAVARFLARPALDNPPPILRPEDWIVQSLADSVTAEAIGDAWFRGADNALCGILNWLHDRRDSDTIATEQPSREK